MVARFHHKPTGQEFFFLVNHLYRGSGVDPRRLDQVLALSEWAAQQEIPIVAVGDHNFDWDLDPDEVENNYDKGFANMTAKSIFFMGCPPKLCQDPGLVL